LPAHVFEKRGKAPLILRDATAVAIHQRQLQSDQGGEFAGLDDAEINPAKETARAIDYSLKRWEVFTRFLDDGRLCMSNNAAERELRAVAVGRKNWTFAGSDEGGGRAAAIYTLIQTAKLNDIDPQAWLADVLTRLPDHPASKIAELLPWNWKRPDVSAAA